MSTHRPMENRPGPRRQFMLLSLAAIAAATVPGFSAADPLLKQATILVGSPPGGATDKLARLFAEGLAQRVAANVIVENRPGAGGAIAYAHVKNSEATDGSLMFLSPAYPIVVSPHVVPDLPYDTLRDFVPVGIAGRSMMTFSVGPTVPASVKTLAEYLQWCKDNPKLALYAAQTGSSQHLVGTSLSLAANVKLDNVSYKGDTPAIQDVLGGHVPALVLPVASAIPQQQSGRMRILAVTGTQRSRFLPEIPTMVELGYPDIIFQDWLGIFAKAGTPLPVLRRINDAMADVTKSAHGQEALALLGFEPLIVTPETFASMVKADDTRYQAMIERTHFRDVFAAATGR